MVADCSTRSPTTSQPQSCPQVKVHLEQIPASSRLSLSSTSSSCQRESSHTHPSSAFLPLTRSRHLIPNTMDRIPSFYSEGGLSATHATHDPGYSSSSSSSCDEGSTCSEETFLNDLSASKAFEWDMEGANPNDQLDDGNTNNGNGDDEDEQSLEPLSLHCPAPQPRSPKTAFAMSSHTSTRTVASSTLSFNEKNHSSGCPTDDSMPSLASFGCHDSMMSMSFAHHHQHPHFHDSCIATVSSEESCDLIAPPVLPYRTSSSQALPPAFTNIGSSNNNDTTNIPKAFDSSQAAAPPSSVPLPSCSLLHSSPTPQANDKDDVPASSTNVRVFANPSSPSGQACHDTTAQNTSDDGHVHTEAIEEEGAKEAKEFGAASRTIPDSINRHHHHFRHHRSSTGCIRGDTIPMTPVRSRSGDSLMLASLHRMTQHSKTDKSLDSGVDTVDTHDAFDNEENSDRCEQARALRDPTFSSPRSTIVLSRSVSESIAGNRWQHNCVRDCSPRDSLTKISMSRQESTSYDEANKLIGQEHILPLSPSGLGDTISAQKKTERALHHMQTALLMEQCRQQNSRRSLSHQATDLSISTISSPGSPISPRRKRRFDRLRMRSLSSSMTDDDDKTDLFDTDGLDSIDGDDDNDGAAQNAMFQHDSLRSFNASWSSFSDDRWKTQESTDDSIPVSPQGRQNSVHCPLPDPVESLQ